MMSVSGSTGMLPSSMAKPRSDAFATSRRPVKSPPSVGSWKEWTRAAAAAMLASLTTLIPGSVKKTAAR